MTAQASDLKALKDGLKATWSAGDYSFIARGLHESALDFLERAATGPGERVLDVACGTGQLALPAARSGADVTGIDIAENWIAQAREQAESQGLAARFDVGDVEDMPYQDGSFDLVMSLIGAMFAPRPERAASQMLRVCRPGGRVVMGNWTAEGFVGRFFKTVAAHVPPPEMPSPLMWGDEAVVRERFGPGVSDLRLTRRMLHFDYSMPPERLADHYFAHFGPTRKAFEALDAGGQAALRADLASLWADSNQATDGTTTQVDAEILEVVAIKA